MERLTKHSKQTSHENGICCTHFYGFECLRVGGNCAMNCKWEEAAWSRLAAYEDTGLEPEAIETVKLALAAKHMVDLETLNNTPISRLVELAEADKDGRVLILPCKVGDTVWANLDGMRHTRKCVIEFANIGTHFTTIVFSTVDGLREQYGVNPSSFGKSVFLTREEAEKALAEMAGKKDG